MTAYRETISQLRREAAERQANELAAEIEARDQERREYEQAAINAVSQGDRDGARWHAEQMGIIEDDIVALGGKLEQVAATLPQELSPEKQDWIAQRSDLADDPRYVELAGHAHNYITQTMRGRG